MNFTLTSSVFPDGTSLRLYLSRTLPSSFGSPVGPAIQTQTVANSAATFISLDAGEAYTAVGLVGSDWRYVQFGTDENPPEYLLSTDDATISGDWEFEGGIDLSGADVTGLATDVELSSAISAHSSDTTGVHGIADTAALATASDVAAAQAAAEAASDPEGTAVSAVATHSGDTTNVHGIADTGDLATESYVDGVVEGIVAGSFADNNNVWRTLLTSQSMIDENVASGWGGSRRYSDGLMAPNNHHFTGADQAPDFCWIDPADFVVTGRDAEFRIVASATVNNATAAEFRVYPVLPQTDTATTGYILWGMNTLDTPSVYAGITVGVNSHNDMPPNNGELVFDLLGLMDDAFSGPDPSLVGFFFSTQSAEVGTVAAITAQLQVRHVAP